MQSVKTVLSRKKKRERNRPFFIFRPAKASEDRWCLSVVASRRGSGEGGHASPIEKNKERTYNNKKNAYLYHNVFFFFQTITRPHLQ